MSPPIGFIILSHHKPHQLLRLVNRLNVMFDGPPIVFHHDFYKCPLPEEKFSSNVSFVRPPLKTAWTEFSIVKVTVASMEKLFSLPKAPDQFVLLSGQDYPIKSARKILSDLTAGGFDAHMSHSLVREDHQDTPHDRMLYRRHLCFNIPPAPIYRWMKRRWPIGTLRYRGPFRWLVPFTPGLECYSGSSWFVANRRVVDHVRDFYRRAKKFNNYYRWRMYPDESYFQTIVLNAGKFRVNNENWRYLDWSSGSTHPKLLGMEDLPKLASSSAHFARKLDLDKGAELFDRLDEMSAG